MPDIKGDFKRFLESLGIDSNTAETASKKHADALAQVQATAASRSSSTSTTSGGNSIASALGAAFIDQQATNLARISTKTGEKIINAIGKGASFNPINIAKAMFDGLLSVGESLLGDIATLNKTLLESTRGAAGYVGPLAESMMSSTRFAMIEAQKYGVATNDTIDAVEKLMVNSERMVAFSDKTLSNALVTSLAFTKNSKTLLENAENFRNVGIGLDSASKSIEEIGSKSVKLGLSAKATSETLIGQLSKLNAFGFQNGIAGLGKMVQQAQSLKINMEEIFKVADKLYDPESAINLAANLQVVGGAVGDLGDPIKLMYDATNNVESLQTSIIGAARSLATYNAEQGRFEVSGANLRRAKAMADALGMSMGELTNMAVKGAAKFEAMSELDMFPSLTDDQREFVSNIATIKDGKVGFDIPKNMVEKMGLSNVKDGFVSLSDLSDKQILQLQQLQKEAADEKPIDIARNQFNETTKILNVATAIYLRLMEDTRSGPAGVAAAKGMEEAAKFAQKFDPTNKNTAQTAKQLYSEVTGLAGDALDKAMVQIKDKMPKELKETIEFLEKKLSEVSNDLDIKEKANEAIEKAKEIIEKGSEKGRELINEGLEKLGIDLRVSVDINSNNTLLAGIIVDEIERTPQLKATLASSIVKSIKDYA